MKIQQRSLLVNPTAFTGYTPFAAKLLAARTTDTRSIASLQDMLPPSSMLGLEAAADVVFNAIAKRHHIVIVGDYDCDGATGTAVGITGLTMLGAKVSYIVPNRFTEGYGLSVPVFERAREMKPDLILTVDNGIASHAGIAAAGKCGIPVVVTDHHLPSDTLPDALAIANPNQPGCQFASKNIAGVGVMFYLIIAVRQKMRSNNDSRGNVDLRSLLDIVALGTVADVVKLDHNNRLLVQAGLNRIRNGQARAGVMKLFDVAKRNAARATSEDLGFYIGPRINAAGRMDDAAVGIACLTSNDTQMACDLADSLHSTNQARRTVQNSIEDEALRGLPSSIDSSAHSICIYGEHWHEGIIGVVSGKLKERFYRPTIVFTKVEDDTAKGSGRSIPGLHLRDCIDAIDKQRPGLIRKFGGHAMAAGLSIDLTRFQEFQALFEQEASKNLSPADLRNVVEHDGNLTPKEITIDNAEFIADGVWGQAFAHPQFLLEAPSIASQRVLNGAHLKLDFQMGNMKVPAIWFGRPDTVEAGASFIAKLGINEWQGKRSPQLIISEAV